MKAQRLIIEEKRREHPIYVANPGDFLWSEGPSVDAEVIIANPGVSLYCLDLDRQSALFVEVDDPNTVEQAPFLYQAQAEHATGLVSMPFSTFHALARKIERPKRGFTFLHSVGRCGSTLLSKVFQALPGMYSLSEPDEPTQLGRFFAQKTLGDDEIRQLLLSSTMWRAKPASEPFDEVVLKYRSEVMVLAPMFAELFPDDRHIFQYRDALPWMRTLFRGWNPDAPIYDEERDRTMATNWAKSIPLVQEYIDAQRPLNAIQIRLLAWIQCMEAYLQMRDQGLPVVALRYEDLNREPEEMVRRLLNHLNIQGVDWQAIEEVLSKDSQAGTIYDREKRKSQQKELTPELIQDVRDLVAERPKLVSTDVLLPGTLMPDTTN